MPRRLVRLHAEQGLTLVELMVASFVLVVGMLATAGMVTTGMAKTNLNAQRTAATNLARELTEAARVAPYGELAPAKLRPAIQAASTTLGTTDPWTVVRRNVAYTVAGSVCTYDDPADKLAATVPDNRCAPVAGTAAQTGDQNGDDFRRVTFTVSWRAEGRTQTFTQSALIVNPSGGLGPRIVPPLPVVAPVTSAGQFSVAFTVETTPAAALRWTADEAKSSGNATGGPKAWSVNWDIGQPGTAGAILDGTYTVRLQAFDERSIPGDAKAVSVALNRSAPFAVKDLKGGHNTRSSGLVDLEWSLNPERDIIGYRVFDAGADAAVGGGDDQLVCPGTAGAWLLNTETSCQDLDPPAGAATYYAVALDRDAAGQPRQGQPTMLSVTAPGAQPDAPPSLTIGTLGPPSLTWTASPSADVAFYRVYRDGTDPDDRIGRLPGTTYVDHGGADGQDHKYWVSAVSSTYNESVLVGPVEWDQ